MSLYIPTYFSPISQYSEIAKLDTVVFEVNDNFQKQTYRNRCYIYGANGKLLLNIPIKHLETSGRRKSIDTLVSDEFPWQQQHIKSLRSAYHSSPYFEFFEDDLMKIFEKNYTYLYDVNIDSYLFVTDALELSSNFNKTTSYVTDIENILDCRGLAVSKAVHNEFVVKPYKQMFDLKHGFLPNISILDLLFMEGPNAISFL